MERISGRIRRAWRRRPTKGRVMPALMAVALLLSTVATALSPIAAYAVEQTITGTCHIEVDDPGRNNGGAMPHTTFFVTMPDGQVITGCASTMGTTSRTPGITPSRARGTVPATTSW